MPERQLGVLEELGKEHVRNVRRLSLSVKVEVCKILQSGSPLYVVSTLVATRVLAKGQETDEPTRDTQKIDDQIVLEKVYERLTD